MAKSFLKLLLFALLIIIVISCTGCNGKAIGKFIKNEAKQQVAESVIEHVTNDKATSRTPDNKTHSSGSVGPRNSSIKSTATKTGAVAATLSMLDNEAKAENSEMDNVKSTLIGYYSAIASHQMRQAYETLSPNMQNQLGTYESFSAGYDTTINNEVTNIYVSDISETRKNISYQLTSTDRINQKNIKQIFIGEAILEKQNGKWLITDMMVKKKS